MFRNNHKTKFLLIVLSFVVLLGISFAATHIHDHGSSKSEQNEANCPLCRLAQATSKFLVDYQNVPQIEPHITVNLLQVIAFFFVTSEIIQPSSIRGPPLV